MAKIDEIKMLRLGQRDENLARSLTFDCSDWLEQYPEASIHILFRRPGESAIVPMSTTLEGTTLTWLIHDYEVGKTGVGNAEFRAVDTAGLRRKSRIIPCSIEETLLGGDETVLYTQDQVDETLAHISEAAQAALAAKASEEAAALSASEAGESAASAGTDADMAASARDAAQAAQTAAETAQHQAEAAQSGVHADAEAAEQAKVAAQAAQASAQGAASQASADRTAAETARSDAEAAAEHAEAVVDGIDQAGADQVAAVNAAGQAQVSAVNQAGTTQVGNVNAAGTTQINAVQAKGTQVIASIPADYSALTDDVTGLKSTLTKTDNMIVYADDYYLPLTWEYGNINVSGENANEDRHFYARTKTAFVPNKTIDIDVKKVLSTGITNYVVVEYDASNHAMTNRTVYQVGTYPNITIHATLGKEYRICIMCNSDITIDLDHMDNYVTVTTQTEIQRLEQGINEINDIIDASGIIPSDNVIQIEYTATLGSMTKTGYINTSATSYGYTTKIPVKEGDVIRSIPYGVGSDLTMRVVTAFNGDTAISDKGVENVASYTVPSGIDGIVVTGYVARANDPSTIPYLFKFDKGYADKATDSNGFVVKRDTVVSGDQILIPLNNVSKNVVLSFDALVDTFDTLEFGRTGITNKVAVTSSNVIFYDENGTVLSTTPHGLTVENTISVRIIHDADINMDQVSVIVSSNGVKADPVVKGWSVYRRGNVYAKSVGSTLNTCTCGFAMQDINKAIWIFGDSACSYTYNRWVGQLVLAGYAKNVLVNAYPGEDASQNIPSLMNLINKGHPKAIVWVNGGNDGTDNTTTGKPNNLWMNAVQIFLTACISRGIIPILCTRATFPGNNPPTTLQNHEYKNAWVRESGYRYIDFAKAVGANSSGEWYPGMQFSDGVHPTEKGAIALFNRAVADCPEFMEP